MMCTSVIALKDVCKSSTLVSRICGTIASTLDRTYDQATDIRTHTVVKLAFDFLAYNLPCPPQSRGQEPHMVVSTNCQACK